MAQVSLKDVSKVYGTKVKVEAVKKVSFGVESREFLVLVGPSGCGKSTLLRMIAGLEEITNGEIFIGNELVNDTPPKDRNIAMVFQNYALYPHMNVYENMSFGLRQKKFPKNEIDSRVKNAAEILGIDQLLKRLPKELSGGQKQRVAVGRAIVRNPMVFLFDEPLSNLDAKFRVQMRTEIHKLHDRLKTTMIYVTHDQVEAMTLGDRVAVMKDGVIHQIDKPINIYRNPVNKFVAGFMGSPPMNFLKGVIEKGAKGLVFHEGSFKVCIHKKMEESLKPYVGKEIVFGIRPEDIYDQYFAKEAMPENTVRVNVDVVELMGSEVYIYLKTDSHSFVARVNTYSNPETGGAMGVVFDMQKAHFFDVETENSIV